jgi:hypothetical protein
MMKDDDDHEIEDPTGVEDQLIPEKSSNGIAKKRNTAARKTKARDPTKRATRRKLKENSSDKFIKYAALLCLVAQMVGLVLLMRYSRTSHPDGQPMYLASTAVFIMEVMKLVICCIVIAYQARGNLMGELSIHVIGAPMELMKLSVPSFLYCVQNNLLYLALTNLDAATYQVCYQLKILTTAIFSAVLLQVCIIIFNDLSLLSSLLII